MLRPRLGPGRAGQMSLGRRWPAGVLAGLVGLAAGAAMVGAGAPNVSEPGVSKPGVPETGVSKTGVPKTGVPGTESAPSETGSASAGASVYIREGTELVNQSGYFRPTGDRVTFFSEGGRTRFIVLENLNLDRVTRAIADEPVGSQWIVTGNVTEFHGTNYLFVRRAVLRNRDEAGMGQVSRRGGVQSP